MLREFADNNSEVYENGREFSKRVENSVGKVTGRNHSLTHYHTMMTLDALEEKAF